MSVYTCLFVCFYTKVKDQHSLLHLTQSRTDSNERTHKKTDALFSKLDNITQQC